MCPELVEAGIIHLVIPPLYSIEYKSRGKSGKIFLPTEVSKTNWMIEKVYMETLEISVASTKVYAKPYKLTHNECVDFIKFILHVGEILTNIANELVIDPIILEALTYATGYIHPGKVDAEMVRNITGADGVIYDANGHLLIMSVGRNDYIIPLQNMCDRLYETVIPLLHKMQWNRFNADNFEPNISIFVNSINSQDFKNTQVSIMQLYSILRNLDDQFTIKRYKGLGSMTPEEKEVTCLKNTMSIKITSVGDVHQIFNYLGDDSVHRKRLIMR